MWDAALLVYVNYTNFTDWAPFKVREEAKSSGNHERKEVCKAFLKPFAWFFWS